MQRSLILGIGFLTLAGCQQKPDVTAQAGNTPKASRASTPSNPPKRKAGLWTQTVSTKGMTQTTRLCLDTATEARLTVWGQPSGKGLCARSEITPTVGGWSFTRECEMGEAGKVSTTGQVTGDFNWKYVIKATWVTTGSTMAQANGTHVMEMTGTWEGPCPAAMKPGDMTLPDGVTLNIAKLAGK